MKRSATKGDVFAQILLGTIFSEDGKVRPDPEEAEKWWLMAASNGNAKAQFLLGGFFARYDLDRRDQAKAIFWTEKAARQRFAGAAEQLAHLRAEIRGEAAP